MRKALIPLVTLLVLYALTSVPATRVFANDPQTCLEACLEACDRDGITVKTFNPGDEVYVKGSGLEPSGIYHIYIVVDHSPWEWHHTHITDLDIIEGPIIVDIDSSGYIENQPVPIWESAIPGYYDVFADCQTDGEIDFYDECDDIDDLDVYDAGFFVIPEIILGTIAVLLACFAAASLKRRKNILNKRGANH